MDKQQFIAQLPPELQEKLSMLSPEEQEEMIQQMIQQMSGNEAPIKNKEGKTGVEVERNETFTVPSGEEPKMKGGYAKLLSKNPVTGEATYEVENNEHNRTHEDGGVKMFLEEGSVVNSDKEKIKYDIKLPTEKNGKTKNFKGYSYKDASEHLSKLEKKLIDNHEEGIKKGTVDGTSEGSLAIMLGKLSKYRKDLNALQDIQLENKNVREQETKMDENVSRYGNLVKDYTKAMSGTTVAAEKFFEGKTSIKPFIKAANGANIDLEKVVAKHKAFIDETRGKSGEEIIQRYKEAGFAPKVDGVAKYAHPTESINSAYSVSAVQKVINKYSGGKSPLKAADFIKVAQETGVPLDLMLSQAAIESNFGTKGRAAKTFNIFNVGNTDSGANETQGSWMDGLYRYANLIKNEYAPSENFTADDIIANGFVRPKLGGSYAPGDYASRVNDILSSIRKDITAYSFNKKSAGVNIDALHNNLKSAYIDLSNRFGDLVITSGNDATHSKGSKHYKNEAIDIRTRDDAGKATLAFIKQNGQLVKQDKYGTHYVYNGIKYLDEGDHLHVSMEHGGKVNSMISLVNREDKYVNQAMEYKQTYNSPLSIQQIVDELKKEGGLEKLIRETKTNTIKNRQPEEQEEQEIKDFRYGGRASRYRIAGDGTNVPEGLTPEELDMWYMQQAQQNTQFPNFNQNNNSQNISPNVKSFNPYINIGNDKFNIGMKGGATFYGNNAKPTGYGAIDVQQNLPKAKLTYGVGYSSNPPQGNANLGMKFPYGGYIKAVEGNEVNPFQQALNIHLSQQSEPQIQYNYNGYAPVSLDDYRKLYESQQRVDLNPNINLNPLNTSNNPIVTKPVIKPIQSIPTFGTEEYNKFVQGIQSNVVPITYSKPTPTINNISGIKNSPYNTKTQLSDGSTRISNLDGTTITVYPNGRVSQNNSRGELLGKGSIDKNDNIVWDTMTTSGYTLGSSQTISQQNVGKKAIIPPTSKAVVNSQQSQIVSEAGNPFTTWAGDRNGTNKAEYSPADLAWINTNIFGGKYKTNKELQEAILDYMEKANNPIKGITNGKTGKALIDGKFGDDWAFAVDYLRNSIQVNEPSGNIAIAPPITVDTPSGSVVVPPAAAAARTSSRGDDSSKGGIPSSEDEAGSSFADKLKYGMKQAAPAMDALRLLMEKVTPPPRYTMPMVFTPEKTDVDINPQIEQMQKGLQSIIKNNRMSPSERQAALTGAYSQYNSAMNQVLSGKYNTEQAGLNRNILRRDQALDKWYKENLGLRQQYDERMAQTENVQREQQNMAMQYLANLGVHRDDANKLIELGLLDKAYDYDRTTGKFVFNKDKAERLLAEAKLTNPSGSSSAASAPKGFVQIGDEWYKKVDKEETQSKEFGGSIKKSKYKMPMY